MAVLQEFAALDIREPAGRFDESLGSLLDLSGRVTLSKMLDNLSSTTAKPAQQTPSVIEKAFFREREALLRFIAQGFASGAGGTKTKNRLPSAAEYHAHLRFSGVYGKTRSAFPENHQAAFEPFGRFYLDRQTRIAARIEGLQDRIRDAMCGLSPALARLATLDRGIQSALTNRSIGVFDGISMLLASDFRRQLEAHWHELPDEPVARDLANWMATGGWICGFTVKMRDLLLAELDTRLQPVLGLIESTNTR